MLPTDSPFRRLPDFVDRADLFLIQTLVFASDVMTVALQRLDNTAALFDVASGDPIGRASILSDAWTIVDQVHVARQLLRIWFAQEPDADIKAYIDKYEVAYALRNKMDHLSTNLPNLANAKNMPSPLLGSVSFFRPFADRWHDGFQQGHVDGEIVVISAGGMTPRTHVSVMYQDLTVRLPVGGIKLEAFGLAFLIERAVEDLLAILTRKACLMPDYIAGVVMDLVENEGMTLEKATKLGHGSPTVYANAIEVSLELHETPEPS